MAKSKRVSVTDLENSCDVQNQEIRTVKKVAHITVFVSEEAVLRGLVAHLVEKLNTDDEFATIEIEVDEAYVIDNVENLEIIQIDAVDPDQLPITMFKVTLELKLEDVEEDE